MQFKKNPEIEVGRFGILYFQVGLAVMMALTYFGLEHKSYRSTTRSVEIVSFDDSYNDSFEEEIPVVRIQSPATVAPAIAIGSDGIKVVDNLAVIEETIMESTETDQLDIVGVVTDHPSPILRVNDVNVKEVEDDVEIPFAVIESAPIFPGCEKGTKAEIRACFQEKIQQHVAEHFVYPQIAKDMGIQGRVFILFTINKKGFITNVQMRGPDKILEKEAERIICLLPQMIPGKQRGKPAKVSYSIPINFKYVDF